MARTKVVSVDYEYEGFEILARRKVEDAGGSRRQGML